MANIAGSACTHIKMEKNTSALSGQESEAGKGRKLFRMVKDMSESGETTRKMAWAHTPFQTVAGISASTATTKETAMATNIMRKQEKSAAETGRTAILSALGRPCLLNPIRIERFVNELAEGKIPPDVESAFPKGVSANQLENLGLARKALDQLICPRANETCATFPVEIRTASTINESHSVCGRCGFVTRA